MSLSAAITARLKTVSGLNDKVFPDVAPSGISYPFCVYKMQNVERFYCLDGSTNGLPIAIYSVMFFGTNRILLEGIAVEAGNLFNGYRGTISGTQIASSVWNNQETNDVFVEGNEILVYSYTNSHFIQFVEE